MQFTKEKVKVLKMQIKLQFLFQHSMLLTEMKQIFQFKNKTLKYRVKLKLWKSLKLRCKCPNFKKKQKNIRYKKNQYNNKIKL